MFFLRRIRLTHGEVVSESLLIAEMFAVTECSDNHFSGDRTTALQRLQTLTLQSRALDQVKINLCILLAGEHVKGTEGTKATYMRIRGHCMHHELAGSLEAGLVAMSKIRDDSHANFWQSKGGAKVGIEIGQGLASQRLLYSLSLFFGEKAGSL